MAQARAAVASVPGPAYAGCEAAADLLGILVAEHARATAALGQDESAGTGAEAHARPWALERRLELMLRFSDDAR